MKEPAALEGTATDAERLREPTLEESVAGPAADLAPLALPGQYRVVGEHARGGVARILAAEDLRLDRLVAIKALLRPSSEARVRFEREARLTARLQHASIVPVYEAGQTADGESYYAMRLVSGRTLKELIEEEPSLERRLGLLRHVTAVAEAVAYAHSQRVIHRDLKPSNVVVGIFGETYVVDWGLAKHLASDEVEAPAAAGAGGEAGATVLGKVIGTPAYMPPEQGEGRAVDERADVYALGAMLYHLLAGAPPYGGSQAGVLELLAAGPPPPVGARAPEAPADLVAIAEQAMARRAEARYPSAAELADDLRRFENGRLVAAYRYPARLLLLRWLRRHRLTVAVAAALLVALAVTLVVSFRNVAAARDRARAHAADLTVARDAARTRTAELVLAHARAALERDPTATLAWLKQYPITESSWMEVQQIAADAVSRRVARHVFAGTGHRVHDLELSPDGSKLAAATGSGAVPVWDMASGRLLLRETVPGTAFFVLFTHGGDAMLYGGLEGAVMRHDLRTGRTHALAASDAVGIGATPDGSHLAAAGPHGVDLWDAGGRRIALDRGHEYITASFSRDGAVLFAAGTELATVWRMDTFARTDIATPHAIETRLTRDGAFVVAGLTDSEDVLVHEVATGRARRLPGHQGGTLGLSGSEDGRLLATAARDGAIRVWDLATGRARLLGRQPDAIGVTFGPGESLVAWGSRGSLQRWDLTGEATPLLGHRDGVRDAAWSSDGKLIATSSQEVRVWRHDPAREPRVIATGHGTVACARFLPGGRLATTGKDGRILVWDLARGGFIQLRGRGAAVDRLVSSRDGHRLAAGRADGGVELWDVAERRIVVRGAPTGFPAWAIDLSEDGETLAAAPVYGPLQIWRAGRPTQRSLGYEYASLDLFSGGKRLAVVSTGSRIWTSDLDTGAETWLTGLTGQAWRVAVSPDAKRVAAAGDGRELRIWDRATGTSVAHPAPAGVRDIAFAPDSSAVTAVGEEPVVAIHDLASGRSALRTGHQAAVRVSRFSPDGRLVASGSDDGTVRLWDRKTGWVEVLRQQAPVTDLDFSPDGSELAVAAGDRVRIWRVVASEEQGPAAVRAYLDRATTAVLGPGDVVMTP